MNCIQATRIKSGAVESGFNLNFDDQSFTVTDNQQLKIDTTYRETCQAQAGEFSGTHAIRGLACDKKHTYRGKIFSNLVDFGGIGFFGRCRFLDTPGEISPYVWRVFISMNLFGGELVYFENKLNAYGRKAKAYYDDPNNQPQLHDISPASVTLVLNAWNPETGTGFAPTSEQAYIEWGGFAYAFGNNIERDLNGVVSISEFITDTLEPFWSKENHAFTGTGKRTFLNLENYGD